MTDRIPQTGTPILDAKSKRPVWHWIIGVLLLCFTAWIIWDINFNQEKQPVHSVSQSVFVPIAATPSASAPETVASTGTPVPVAPPKTYTVEQGDWLSLVFPNNWKAVCDLNAKILKKGCSHIVAGQELQLPVGVEPTEKSARAAKPKMVKAPRPQTTTAPIAATPKTNAAGEILYRRVGTAPLNGCGKRDIADISRDAWEVLGLSKDDQAWLQLNADLANGPRINITAAEGLAKLDTDTRLEQVTFCRKGTVVSRGPMRTAWDADQAVYGERFVLPSGKVLVWMRNCFNWVILPEEKKEPPAPPPPPAESPVVPTPAPPTPIPEPSASVPVAEAPKGICDRFDPHAVIGQEYEPRHDGGDRADSSYLSAALFCTWYDEKRQGTHGLGLSLTASTWSGTVNQRAGKYQGNMHLVGPAYEFISDNGWDATVSVPMVGRLHEKFSQDQYRSQRDFSLIGLSAGYNNYERRLRGEKWFPETQVFGTWAKPLSRTVAHSWEGQPIADTAELSRFDTYLNLGVRQWLYETDESLVLPYAQLGYFLESPGSESLSVRMGISDPARIVGVGVGFDHDLERGGDVAAWGWWLDVAKGIQVGRSKYRKHQILVDAERRGITVEENRRGYIESIRFGEPKPDKQ